MLLEVSDVVETGSLLDTGGTIDIKVVYDVTYSPPKRLIEVTEKVIDLLDHTLVTTESWEDDVEFCRKFSQRHIITKEDNLIFEANVALILMTLLKLINYNPVEISVTRDKTTITIGKEDKDVELDYLMFSEELNRQFKEIKKNV